MTTSEHKPDLIQIETTTACPARCPMCPRSMGKRGSGTMDGAMFYDAVRQSVECGCTMVLPFINGEPLADVRMPVFVETISREYPGVEIGFYTNAWLLDDIMAHRLFTAGGIKTFNISLQGGNRETYERNTGLAWDRIISNVSSAVATNTALGNPVKMRLNMCVFSKTSSSLHDFHRLASDLGVDCCPGCFSNFGGMVTDEEGEALWRDKPRLQCDRALHHVYVYWNGDIGQCCFDLIGNAVYGNLNTGTLRKALDSEKHRRMRNAHSKIDVAQMPEVCRNCNSPKFHG